jgi:hypothetical protein
MTATMTVQDELEAIAHELGYKCIDTAQKLISSEVPALLDWHKWGMYTGLRLRNASVNAVVANNVETNRLFGCVVCVLDDSICAGACF